MKLKTNYQYTYFIQPYIVKESRYTKYLLKLLKDKNCKLHIFQKEKELDLYNYFLPRIREFMFSTFEFNNSKLRKVEEVDEEAKANILKLYPCTIFDYEIKEDVQGRAESENGIYFKINKIQIICFKTGICFLCIKTHIEESNEFSDILNFNYKFRDINQEFNKLMEYDKIKIQTDAFSNMKDIKNFMKDIIGNNEEALNFDINTERFFTYSYSCVDQENWNNTTNMQELNDDFIKYVKILPSDNIANLDNNEMQVISDWKYAKLGLTKMGCMLFSSSSDINNYTVLPHNFENQYFYTYILNIYEKLYLKKLNIEITEGSNIKYTSKKLIEFSKKLWGKEITNEDLGALIHQRLRKTLETDSIYNEIKSKYDVMYKNRNIEKDKKVTIVISIILTVSLIFNIINFILLMKGD